MCGLKRLDFFRYLQTRTSFNNEIKSKEKFNANLIDIFIDIYKNMDNRKLVSKLYSSIQSSRKHSTDKVRLKWEKESGFVISEEDWSNPLPPARVFGGNSVG